MNLPQRLPRLSHCKVGHCGLAFATIVSWLDGKLLERGRIE